jgi:hypothetical protein
MGPNMISRLAIIVWLALIHTSVLADFSRSQISLHPQFPGTGPFILEIGGIWPSDCHPGEQKPVVESYDGHVVEIGFEIVVVHVTCNTSDTDYRVLVDMSESVRARPPLSNDLQVRVSFQGASRDYSHELACPVDVDCSGLAGSGQKMESGLYGHPDLAKQGLLVTRQNEALGIFPLVYDEFGRSAWLFSGNRVEEDSFFAEILQPSGGDCFGCEPSGDEPRLTPIGYLSVLADRPGILQVKINDGPFVAYRQLVFGYRTFAVGDAGQQILIDLEGRWGISENRGSDPPLGDLTEFFPGVFDIELEYVVTVNDEFSPSGEVSYRVRGPTGQTLGQLVCKGQSDPGNPAGICEFIDPTDAAEPLFLFYQQGPSRLAIEYGRAVIAVGTAPGGWAVRLD